MYILLCLCIWVHIYMEHFKLSKSISTFTKSIPSLLFGFLKTSNLFPLYWLSNLRLNEYTKCTPEIVIIFKKWSLDRKEKEYWHTFSGLILMLTCFYMPSI